MAADRVKRERPAETRDEGSDRLLVDYLKEVGTTPLLERELELQHAATLAECRRDFTGLVLEIPERQRREVLHGVRAPEAGRRWPLRELDSCHRAMAARLADTRDPQLSSLLARANRLKQRIDASRDALVLANLRFVAHLAKQMTCDRLSFLDLIQEGNLGLIEAVERFEHERGHRFATYAYWWIRRAISLAVSGKSLMIYVPAHMRESVGQLHRARVVLKERLGRPPSPEELAVEMRMSVRKIRQLESLVREPQPLESLDDYETWTADPLRRTADPNGTDPLVATLHRERREKLAAAMRVLNRQQRTVIEMRFGFGRHRRRLTLKEVGKEIGVSRERVRQIERYALAKLVETPEARSLAELREEFPGGAQPRRRK